LAINRSIDNPILYPIKDNNIRWFSTYIIIKRGIIIKDSLDLFLLRNQTSKNKDNKNLSGFMIISEDWLYINNVFRFMAPLFLLVKELEGKSTAGNNGYVNDVLPVYNILRAYIEEELRAFDPI
jgi:hypothetical protein